MNLETPRCVIRQFVMEDAFPLHQVLSDNDVMAYIEPAFSFEQTQDFIQNAAFCHPPLVYAVVLKETKTVIGHVIFHPYEEDSYELGWIIRKDCWGKGIASELTTALLQYAKTLDLRSCVIECDTDQTVTAIIAKKYGFSYEGEDEGCAVYRKFL